MAKTPLPTEELTPRYMSIPERAHQRILGRAAVHIALSGENQFGEHSPLAGLERNFGEFCLGLAEVVAKLDRRIDHDSIVRTYPILREHLGIE